MVQVITVRDGEIVINRHECLAIKELKKIATRVVGMPGDSDGRKKMLNTLEMMFVKYYAETRIHSTSVYAGFSKADKIRKIAEDIGMPEDWKPDEYVWAAVNKYAEILDDYIPTAKVLNSFEKGLVVIAESNDIVVEELGDFIHTLKKIKDGKKNNDLDIETVEKINNAISTIQVSITNFVKLAKDLPAMLDTIEKLRVDVRKEEGQLKRKRGGKTIGNREDPK